MDLFVVVPDLGKSGTEGGERGRTASCRVAGPSVVLVTRIFIALELGNTSTIAS